MNAVVPYDSDTTLKIRDRSGIPPFRDRPGAIYSFFQPETLATKEIHKMIISVFGLRFFTLGREQRAFRDGVGRWERKF